MSTQMADLPAEGEGLSWIVDQDPTKLLLIPGLQPASIAAAAAGDHKALAHLRSTAQHHAADPGVCLVNALDRACHVAATLRGNRAWRYFVIRLEKTDPHVAHVLKARENDTVDRLRKAARTGELAALKWLRAICPQTWRIQHANVLSHAAEAGQLHILRYLHRTPDHGEWYALLTAAAEHLDCMKWLLSPDAPGREASVLGHTLADVAQFHGLPALEWFHANGALPQDAWISPLPVQAAHMGDQPMLEWLRAQSLPVEWSTYVCGAAARRGDISMLRWLRSQDPPCPWDSHVTAAAASRGDLITMQWLRDQDPPCPWDPSACAAAAKHGNLEVLIWLRAQYPPCPWDGTCLEAATCQPNAEILEWLDRNGCSHVPNSFDLHRVANCGHLAELEWLSDHGWALTGRLYNEAAYLNRAHIVKFLHEKKVPLPTMEPIFPCTWPPILMLLADIGMALSEVNLEKATRARRAHCTFHGLLRWFKRAVSDPSRGAHLAFDSLAEDRSGQMLLYRLSLLPSELISRIAVAAEIQHDLTLSG